mmetsp:Transcript_32459/g.66084  ORF Transcript_32459/g.66084 Transcript_32459/m.66084 type:complete len:84 (+) Transcript_32459:514-765(+)
MLGDRDVTLQWWCEEAGGRQTIYYERGVLGSVISVSVLMMMGFYGVMLAEVGGLATKDCSTWHDPRYTLHYALIQGAVCVNAP